MRCQFGDTRMVTSAFILLYYRLPISPLREQLLTLGLELSRIAMTFIGLLVGIMSSLFLGGMFSAVCTHSCASKAHDPGYSKQIQLSHKTLWWEWGRLTFGSARDAAA